jgi:DNA polymerase-3 subunit delta'
MQNQHEREIENLEKTLAVMGVKRGGKKALEERHKRELRRHRTEELRAGLTEVAGVYRDELARNAHIHRPESYVTAINRLHQAMRTLSLNVNEAIMLRDLIWSLPSPYLSIQDFLPLPVASLFVLPVKQHCLQR